MNIEKLIYEAEQLLRDTKNLDFDAPDAKESMEDIDWDDATPSKRDNTNSTSTQQEEEKKKKHAEKKKLAKKRRKEKQALAALSLDNPAELSASKAGVDAEPTPSKYLISTSNTQEKLPNQDKVPASRKEELKKLVQQRKFLNQAKQDPRMIVPVLDNEFNDSSLQSLKEFSSSIGSIDLVNSTLASLEVLLKKMNGDTEMKTFASSSDLALWQTQNPTDQVVASKSAIIGPSRKVEGELLTCNKKLAQELAASYALQEKLRNSGATSTNERS